MQSLHLGYLVTGDRWLSPAAIPELVLYQRLAIGAYVRAEEYLLVLKKRFILCALVL